MVSLWYLDLSIIYISTPRWPRNIAQQCNPHSSWLVLHQRSFNHHQAALFLFSLSFNIYCRNLKCQIFSPPTYRWYRWQIWGMGNALSAKRRGCICISVFFCIWTFFAFKRESRRGYSVVATLPVAKLKSIKWKFHQKELMRLTSSQIDRQKKRFQAILFFHLQPSWSDKNHLQKLSFYSRREPRLCNCRQSKSLMQ